MVELGDIVLAEIISPLEDRVYTLSGELASGKEKGRPTQIIYGGDPKDMVGRSIIAIVSIPSRSTKIKSIDLSTNFLTSQTQYFRAGMNAKNSLLYGIWKKEWMTEGFPLPRISQIHDYYPIGGFKVALLFAYGEEKILPYRVIIDQDPELFMHYDKGSVTRIRNIKSSMRRHISKQITHENRQAQQGRYDFQNLRVIIAFEDIDLKSEIVPRIKGIVNDNLFGIEYMLQLEPQVSGAKTIHF